MALGDMKLFQWKGKEQLEREAAEYEVWAFPFGERQKEVIASRLSELLPKENDKLCLISFLTCKEIYGKSAKDKESQDDIIREFVQRAHKYKNLVKKKHVTTYLALVLDDLDVDEECNYSTTDEIRELIAELDAKLL